MIAITDIDENRTSNDIDLCTVLVGLVAAIGEAAHDADGDEDDEAEVGGGCHVVPLEDQDGLKAKTKAGVVIYKGCNL